MWRTLPVLASNSVLENLIFLSLLFIQLWKKKSEFVFFYLINIVNINISSLDFSPPLTYTPEQHVQIGSLKHHG